MSAQSYPQFTIIVPMLNESEQLQPLIMHLNQWQSSVCEVLLVDGGSEDDSVQVAQSQGFTVLNSARGRARQMNCGATHAKGQIVIFLHADTRLPSNALEEIANSLVRRSWGRFDVSITGVSWMLKVVSFLMNCRSRITGIATGDQAIFMRKTVFELAGGFPELPLMEDIELSKRLKRFSHPACIRSKVLTSGRRWVEYGIWRTIWLMWRLRWAYWRGVPAEQLSRLYH